MPIVRLVEGVLFADVFGDLREIPIAGLDALRILALLIIRAAKVLLVKINGVALYAPVLRDTQEIHTNDVFEVTAYLTPNAHWTRLAKTTTVLTHVTHHVEEEQTAPPRITLPSVGAQEEIQAILFRLVDDSRRTKFVRRVVQIPIVKLGQMIRLSVNAAKVM